MGTTNMCLAHSLLYQREKERKKWRTVSQVTVEELRWNGVNSLVLVWKKTKNRAALHTPLVHSAMRYMDSNKSNADSWAARMKQVLDVCISHFFFHWLCSQKSWGSRYNKSDRWPFLQTRVVSVQWESSPDKHVCRCFKQIPPWGWRKYL